ncbi:HEPN domain-containing protein [uncultured Sphingomonas sp.]|uniref:ApeA N-terminal domain 1-containing protein n=1 Tax=uncultured Sphingomonas sp. TaxID=158754 RepID=UPI0025DD7E92|nr:HEPN domain-containing protein [uncultured Sphingomonas sp.]
MAAPPGMNDQFREDGLWWLPGGEDDKVAGELTFNQEDGAVLKLLGSFEGKPFRPFQSDLKDHPVILGALKDGKAVTLLDSLNTGRHGAFFGGFVRETHKPHLTAIGLHFDSEKEAIFTKGYVRFEDIEAWLGDRFFDLEFRDDHTSLDLHVNRRREAPLGSFEEGILTFGSSLYTDQSETDYTITAHSYVSIEPSEKRSLAWFFSAASKIQSLASLCTGRHLPLLSLTLDGPEKRVSPDRTHPADVRVYAQMSHSESQKARRHDVPLIRAHNLTAYNSNAFKVWFSSYDEIASALHLFFAVQGAKWMYINVRFLLAIQALEVFHRLTCDDTIMDEAEHQALQIALLKAIPQGTPPRMRNKLEGTLQFSNEPSLMQRLKSIMTQVRAEFGETPGGFSNSYLHALVTTRNYYTHYSPGLEGKTLEGTDMHYATRRIILLLTVLLLLRLGIGAEGVRGALTNHREFRTLWDKAGVPK